MVLEPRTRAPTCQGCRLPCLEEAECGEIQPKRLTSLPRGVVLSREATHEEVMLVHKRKG